VLSVFATARALSATNGIRDTTLLSAATNATLTFRVDRLGGRGIYTVKVTNGDGGSVTSTGAIVTVGERAGQHDAFSYQGLQDLLLVFRKAGQQRRALQSGGV